MYSHVTCGRTVERGSNLRKPLSYDDKNQGSSDQGNNIRSVCSTLEAVISAALMPHVTNYICILTIFV